MPEKDDMKKKSELEEDKPYMEKLKPEDIHNQDIDDDDVSIKVRRLMGEIRKTKLKSV